MAEKRTIELEIQDNSKSLKSQYKEAVAELQKMSAQYGETSKEAVKAAQAAAQLKDQIAFSKDLVSSFNPDAKFDSLSKSIGGVLNGFQAYEGAMGLIGVQNEELQATMLKVQSAMALSQGIQGVFEAKDAFVQLGTVLKSTAVGQALLTAATAAYTFVTTASTTGLKLFRIALISTGIGLLIVGVGLLVANFDKLVSFVKNAVNSFTNLGSTTKNIISVMFPLIGLIRLVAVALEEMGVVETQQEKNQRVRDEATIKRHHKRMDEIAKEKALRDKLHKTMKEAYDNQDKAANREIALLKAQGKDTTALERARLQATINYQTNLQNESAAIFNQNKAKHELTKAELYAIGVRNDDFKEYNKYVGDYTSRQNDLLAQNKEANEARKDAVNQLAIFEIEVRKRNAESQSNYNQQSINSDTKTAVEKLDISRKLKDDELRILEDGFDKEMSLLNEKRKREKEDADKQFKEGVLKKEDYNKLLASIDSTYEADRKKIYEKDTAEQIKTRDFTIQGLIDTKTKEVEIENEAYLKKKEIKDKEAEEDIARQQRLNDLRFKAAKDTLQVISNVTELFAGKSKAQQKKAFQVQKAVSIAGATMDTYKAAASALDDSPAPFNYIAMAAVITAGLLNVKKIAAQKFEGGGSSGGGGGTGGGGAAPITPQFNTVGNNGINQLAQLQQQPVQAYVVSGEVTSQQSLDRNRAQNSSL